MAARYLFGIKSLVSSAADALSFAPISRRGYAAASNGFLSAGLGRGGGSAGSMVGKLEERTAIQDSEGANAWAPDPVTGYYRPANHAAEIDPAELREMLLKHRVKPY